MLSVLLSLRTAARRTMRTRAALQLEIVALRHQLQVLEPSRPPRVRLTSCDRRLWVWLTLVGMPYVDPGIACYEERDRQRVIHNQQRRARDLGIRLVPNSAGVSLRNPAAFFAEQTGLVLL